MENPLRTERKIELAAVILVLVLCLQLLYSGARLIFASGPSAIAPALDALQVRQIHSSAAVAASQSEEVRSRPLFWQTRRPLESTAVDVDSAEVEKSAGQLKGVKLLGVFASGDTAGIIVLVEKKKKRILQGESVNGWTLESVELDRVVVVDGARREELFLMTGNIVAVKKPVSVESANSAVRNPATGPEQATGFSPAPGAAPGHGIPRTRGVKR
jgi:hypothetical protein